MNLCNLSILILQRSLAASTSQCEDSQPSRGKESSSRTEAQHHTASASSLRSCILLCRDGIPEALADLYRTSDVGTVHEAAWVVIHFLMLETGYICASEVVHLEKVFIGT